MRRNAFFFLGCGLLIAWCSFWLFLAYPMHMRKKVPKAQNSIEALRPRGYVPKAPDTESTILFYDFPSYYELDKIPPQNCNKKCKFTIQSSEAPSADAIVVFSHDHILGRSNLDLIKRPGQTWVFFAVESPTYSFQTSLGHQKFQQHFNWTMTYRWDSDIFFGYIKTNKRSSPATNKEREIGLQEMREAFRKKSKMVAWMVSHCETDSRRERYVRELKKHIQVDVYGACGDLKCANWTVCDQKVAEDYKFYLSFENTLCKDYASEKLAKVLKQQQTIPIVRGGADYKALCPPNSVVNTADFPSAAALAEYLKQLANDEDAYVKMLQWGWDYEVVQPVLPFCQVCEWLYDGRRARKPYWDAVKWWHEGACHRPQDL